MWKRISVLFAAGALFVLFGACSFESDSSDRSYELYQEAFYEGVSEAESKCAACLRDYLDVDMEGAIDVLNSYLAGEGVYTRDEAVEALETVGQYYDQVTDAYCEIAGGAFDIMCVK